MKNILFFSFTLFLVSGASAQEDKVVESKIARVTVFLNKAQVTRELKTRVPEGKTNIVVSGLTAQLDPNSIQVSAKGNLTLLGISHQQNFLSDLATPGRLKNLQDSVSILQEKILFENMQKQILEKEEQMLISNQKIGGVNQNLPVNELKSMAEFFRTRLSEIAVARMKHDGRIKDLTERLSRMQRQIQTLNETGTRNTSEIVVAVSAKSQTDVELVIDYVVANAGWVPLYDLRAINTKEPLSLFYKANVFQRTGENWNNVKLRLSTANPSLGGVKPDLRPWLIDFYQKPYYDQYRKRAAREDAPAPSQAMESKADAGTIADFVTVQQTSVNTQFDISIPYTVISASKPTTVDIGRFDLNVTFRYAATPKLDPDAFLMAGATGWSEFNLLPGDANVFFEGTFVGKTFLDPQSIKDTLFLSMGRDRRIVVKREKIKDFNSHAVIGLNQKEDHGFEINVRNNQSLPVTIAIDDQIPVSGNSDIQVALLDGGGAQYTPADGKLVWKITLKPNENRKLTYRFEVKFPREKLIAGLN